LLKLAKADAKKYGAKSTADDYSKVVEEFKEYLEEVHGTKNMTIDHTFRYLFYVANRPKRSNGAVCSSSETGESLQKVRRVRHKFDIKEYDTVMEKLANSPADTILPSTAEEPKLLTLSKHYYALLDYALDNIAEKMKHHSGMKKLRAGVIGWQKHNAELLFDEKINPQLEKFGYAELGASIEQHFWDKFKVDQRKTACLGSLCGALRNRYHLLTTIQTLARHDSCLHCKLSSFTIKEWTVPTEPQAYTVLFRNVTVAKNLARNQSKSTQMQTKSIRHKNPIMCEQGALAMFLFVRFLVTCEVFDLCDNESWFHVHTSTDCTPKGLRNFNPFQNMSESTYYAALVKAFKAHGERPSHVRHFGRCAGAAFLELMEVSLELIRMLGNWLENIHEMHYSLKIGWEALRVAAGFPKEQGSYYVPRSKVEVPQELKDLVFPHFKVAKDQFLELPQPEQISRKTSRQFIDVMDYLSEVFVQDVCALLLTDSHKDNWLFTLPFFQEPLFLQYREKFEREMVHLTDPMNDPTIDPIKKAAPLIGNHIAGIHTQQQHQGAYVRQFREDVIVEMKELKRKQDEAIEVQKKLLEALQHEQYVRHATFEAHVNSPFRNKGVNCDASPSVGEGTTCHTGHGDMFQYNGAHNTNNMLETAERMAEDMVVHPNSNDIRDSHDNATPKKYPPLCTSYTSLEDMKNTWNGAEGSMYQEFGGLKELWKDNDYQKLFAEKQKKAIRRLQYINRYFVHRLEAGCDWNDVVEDINKAFEDSNKTEITLSGTELILRKKLHWKGK
jgi:hypothetical protein